MGLYGNIDMMSVPELFEWVNRGRKSGTLEVERDKIIKRIMVREGRVVGCSSNAPTTLLGQFLLSRGKITRQVLSEAMRRHEQSATTLGETLVAMGAISAADQDAFVANKIEETIFGLFDWPDAVFRFYTDALPDPNALDVDLGVREILERGGRRTDERKRSSEAITDPGIVLRRTGESSPPELEGHVAARRIYDLIDGQKTVAEVLLHSHAPEFLVTKFLTVLIQARAVEVVEQAVVEAPDVEVLESVEPVAEPDVEPDIELDVELDVELDDESSAADISEGVELVFESVPDNAPDISELAVASTSSVAETEEPDVDMQQFEPEIESLMAAAAHVENEVVLDTPAQSTPEESRELQEEINVALQLMSSGQPEAALELLNAMAAAHPGDVSLSQMVGNAERDFRQQVLAGELQLTKIPTRMPGAEPSRDERTTADEFFLLEQIDGVTDIQALLWVTPMRDVEVLKTLSRLLRRGWIEVRQAA
jgi:hypothetical protein